MFLRARILSRVSLYSRVPRTGMTITTDQGIAKVRQLSSTSSLSFHQTLFRLAPQRQNTAPSEPKPAFAKQDLSIPIDEVELKFDSFSGGPIGGDPEARRSITFLENLLARFEESIYQRESVEEKEFVRVFDKLTETVMKLEDSNNLTDDVKITLSIMIGVLMRCCGKLMKSTPEKARELLAGNLWQYMSEKQIPKNVPIYNNLLRVLNENNTSFAPQKIIDEMSEAGLTPDRVTYQRLLHQYCVQGDINGATSLLEKMKDLNMELTETIFASLIIGYGKQERPPPVTEMFDLMRSNGIEPGSRSYTSAIISLADLMIKDQSKSEEIKTIYDLSEQEDVQFSPRDIEDLLVKLVPLKKDPNVKSVVDRLFVVPIRGAKPINSILTILFQAGEYEEASRFYWSKGGSHRYRRGNYYVKLMAAHNMPPDFVLSECEKLTGVEGSNQAFYDLYYHSAQCGRLDLVRAAIKKLGEDGPLKSQYCWPLLAQAPDRSALIAVLKNDLNPSLPAEDLVDTFVSWVWPRLDSEAKELFELNTKELHYDTNVLMLSFLFHSIQEDKLEEAVKFLSEIPDEFIKSPDIGHQDDNIDVLPAKSIPNNGIGRLGIENLLNQIAEYTREPEVVEKAFTLCQLRGKQVTSVSSRALVKVHILRKDYKRALERFFELYDEHRVTPCARELLRYCLETNSQDSLQKLMDCLTNLYGESNALLDLAACCLQAGKVKQAQKIFASPDFRAHPLKIYSTCNLLARLHGRTNISIVENFVHLSRDMYDVNQDRLYEILLEAYQNNSNGQRALDLWNKMQEEDFMPSKKCLSLLAGVLQKNNIKIPFFWSK